MPDVFVTTIEATPFTPQVRGPRKATEGPPTGPQPAQGSYPKDNAPKTVGGLTSQEP